MRVQALEDKKSVLFTSTLVVMRGYPGTGKSTVAQALCRTLRAPLLDRDIIRQVGVDMLGDYPEMGRFSYELLFALTREQLRLGLSVVIDTPLTYRMTYERARDLAHVFAIPMLVVHCQCSPELQKRRLEQRKGKVTQFQITSWEEWERWKPRFEEFADHGCIIDTAFPLEISLATIMNALSLLHSPH